MSLLKIPALMAMQGSVAQEKAKLIAEEVAANVEPAIRAAVEAICAAKDVQVQGQALGQPALGGTAANVWAQVTGIDFQGDGFAGFGLLAGSTVADAADFPRFAAELAAYMPVAPPAPVGLLPPDAPKSDPVAALAAMAPKETVPPTTTPVTMSTDTGRTSTADTPPAEEPKRRGRKPKSEGGPIAEVTMHVHASAPATGISLFVDCIAPTPTTDLHTWVQEQAKRLADQYGAVDVRCASNDTPLGFGRWKGALAALVREAPLADGSYFLDTRGSEIAEVAAEALRSRASVTRGIR